MDLKIKFEKVMQKSKNRIKSFVQADMKKVVIGSVCLTSAVLLGAYMLNTNEIEKASTIKTSSEVSNKVSEYEKEQEAIKQQQLKNNLLKADGLYFKKYSLLRNNEVIGLFNSKEEAKQVLDKLKNRIVSKDENITYESIEFKEDVTIEPVITDFENAQKCDEVESAYKYIVKGTNEEKLHKVQKGESFWTIATKYDITVDNLVKANADIDPKTLQIGQEVSLIVPKPLVTVITEETVVYEDQIKYEVEYEKTSSLYEGESQVKRYGKYGTKEVVANIIRENGIEIDKKIENETIVTKPTTKIVYAGTKPAPPKKGTGVFSMPTSRGVLTSPFGNRWGRHHDGIDIGLPMGSRISAADGGKVTFSGWKSGYGWVVIIDHGGGYESVYGHNSKLHVKRGEKVFKGQKIASSGNSGRSTGPHLHFEVRKYGTPVNPEQFSNIRYKRR